MDAEPPYTMKTMRLDELLRVLERRLGESRSTGTGFWKFKKCPWANHRTPFSFGVNPKTRVWHCFACGRSGPLADLGIKATITHTGQVQEEWSLARRKTLPDGALLPWVALRPYGECELLCEHAVEYLRLRGVDREFAARQGVGYGVSGKWVGYTIHPWYDDDGALGGWQGRLMGEPQEGMPKTRTTSPPRTLPSGKVVGDGAFVFKTSQGALGGIEGVRAGHPVLLVEGPYDALSAQRVMPACWMMGGQLHHAQYKRLLKRRPSKIIHGNDPDKYEEALKNARRFYGKGDVQHLLMEWGEYLGDWAADADGDPLVRPEVEAMLTRVRPFRPGE